MTSSDNHIKIVEINKRPLLAPIAFIYYNSVQAQKGFVNVIMF